MDSAQSANGQQFCLRWHNHQSSLLSSLPLLLDQSHLTDVTISAEGRTVRAHRVVLSACSTFFCDLFRTLEPPYHPVIVLPGASFSALVALLSFMYSGEVNVSEEQIPTLLNLAETLGIKGLADFNGNASKQMPSPKREKDMSSMCDTEPASPTNSKISASPTLESLFNKPQFPFFPLLPAVAQPLNFSQHSARLATDLFNKFNNQLMLNQQQQQHQPQAHNKDSQSPESDSNMMEEDMRMNKDNNNNNNNSNNSRNKIRSELKKIDKIAENLRTTNKFFLDHQHQMQLQKSISSLLPQQLAAASPLLLKPPLAACSASMHNFLQPGLTPKDLDVNIKSEMNCAMDNNAAIGGGSEPSTPTGLMPKTDLMNCNSNSNNEATNLIMDKSAYGSNQSMQHPQSTPTPPGSSGSVGTGAIPTPANTKAGNSKLFATCFICHKQLSNQYNLRVHLETHQNVRYACTVCTHVSRSKDALRKHVSYRHPGAPSPCESETRRKRNKMMNQQQAQQQQMQNLQIKQEMIEVQNFLQHHQQQAQHQQQLMALAAASSSSVPQSPTMSLSSSSMGMPQSPQVMPSTPPITPNSNQDPMNMTTGSETAMMSRTKQDGSVKTGSGNGNSNDQQQQQSN